jgi:protein-L-isoaspartate O-methyltransferase
VVVAHPLVAAARAAGVRDRRVLAALAAVARTRYVRPGDGSEGLAAYAPYAAIVVAAAHPFVPPPLAAQLTPGGRLVQPIGPSGSEDVTLFRGAAGGRLIRVRVIARANFVALYGRHGFAPPARETTTDGG